MKKTAITILMDEERMRAVKMYMEKKEAGLERELEETLERLYEKYVPANVRDYLLQRYETETPAKAKKERKKQSGVTCQEAVRGDVLAEQPHI